MRTLLLLLIAGCGGKAEPTDDTAIEWVVDTAWVPPGCGDGVVEGDEECDDGPANANVADACRESCLLPTCGDRIVDGGEECDDGAALGGDGCDPLCRVESGPGEVELNDEYDAANDLPDGGIWGNLGVDDVDCFLVDVPVCGSVAAVLDDGFGACTTPARVSLHDAASMVATGSTEEDGCARLDPVEAPGARWLDAGTYAVCAEGLLGEPVAGYHLRATVGDSLALTGIELPDDLDGDGIPAKCDDDDDGDGVLDVDDNCPDLPNGDEAVSPTTEHDGFIRHWLTIGPFDGLSSPDGCLPTEEYRLGDDPFAAPRLGDLVDDLVWTIQISGGNRLDYEGYRSVDPDREVYSAVYVYSEDDRDLTFALGPDDGARVWLNGEEVLAISGCQGTNVDQFTADVTLVAGWNRLLIKVLDHGGGWGTYARFKDGEDPVRDLELSLDPDGPWTPGQSDLDGDGVGDVCDDTPLDG